MAKIDAYVPDPKPEYDASQQRQTLDALNTLINQLNFGYQKDLKMNKHNLNGLLANGKFL
jgi:hypothetical protein